MATLFAFHFTCEYLTLKCSHQRMNMFLWVCFSRIAALEKAMEALVFFTSHEWVFSSSGASNLVQCLDAADIDTFNFDMSQMIWDTYLTSFSHGLKIYLLKDDPPRWAKSTL